LEPHACGVALMRAQMKSLAKYHAAVFAYTDGMGGKKVLLKRHEPHIRERRLPKMSQIKVENMVITSLLTGVIRR